MKKQNDFMLPTSDFCFKQLLMHPQIRIGFLSALLEIEPESIQETILLPTIMEPPRAKGKISILDIRIQLMDGTQIDVEMQKIAVPHWDERRAYYLSQMIVDQIERGRYYDALHKCIHVSILDFNLYLDDDRCYRSLALCDVVTGEISSNMFEFKVIELKKEPVENGTAIVDWIRFFSGTSRKELKMLAEKNNYLNLGYELLEQLSSDERKRLEERAERKAIMDYHDIVTGAEQRGLEQGIQQERQDGLRKLQQERQDGLRKLQQERQKSLQQQQESLRQLITACHSLGATKDYIAQQIVDAYHLTLEEAFERVAMVLS